MEVKVSVDRLCHLGFRDSRSSQFLFCPFSALMTKAIYYSDDCFIDRRRGKSGDISREDSSFVTHEM